MLSCLNFNSYFKAQLITSDYHGDIKLWDVAAERPVRLYDEHRERAWTVDFSTVNPVRFASGGDDKMVRVWDANERYSTINIAQDSSVCSVKFSPDSEFHLAVGGAGKVQDWKKKRMNSAHLSFFVAIFRPQGVML